MKKIISILAALGLVATSSETVIACSVPSDYNPENDADFVYDQDGNKISRDIQNTEQDYDIWGVWTLLFNLDIETFPNSESFYNNLNEHKSSELNNYLPKETDKPDLYTHKFDTDFKLIITNYDSLSNKIMNKIYDERLKSLDDGNFLILNLVDADLNNIQNEREIDAEFIYLTKQNNNIVCDNDKNYFFWSDQQFINSKEEGGYSFVENALFYLIPMDTETKVITNFESNK